MLQRLNKRLEKIMPLITPTSVILGVLFASYLKEFSYLIPYIFAFMTFAGSLGSNFKSFKDAVSHPVPILVALMMLHVVMPLWALLVGHIAFHGDAYTITGLVMVMVIPTGITSFIWASIYKGNIALTLSIILIDTFLSPFIVPYTLSLVVGQKVNMDVWGMMSGLFGMVVIPSLIAMFLNQWTKGKSKDMLGAPLAPLSKICVGITVMLNGAVVAPYLRHIDVKLVEIVLVVFFVAVTGYWFSFMAGKLTNQDKGTVVSLIFTCGMRNISAGAVLAVSYFPAAVAVPVVVGMLFQQVLASINGAALDKYYKKQVQKQSLSA
jgi:predicted Na+-dependent transporter